MKLLKIDGSSGHYRGNDGDYRPLDKVDKEDLLRLVNWTLTEDEIEFDEYDESRIKNQAHQVIYRSIFRKLKELRARKQEFIDESARLFLEDYEKYRDSTAPSS